MRKSSARHATASTSRRQIVVVTAIACTILLFGPALFVKLFTYPLGDRGDAHPVQLVGGAPSEFWYMTVGRDNVVRRVTNNLGIENVLPAQTVSANVSPGKSGTQQTEEAARYARAAAINDLNIWTSLDLSGETARTLVNTKLLADPTVEPYVRIGTEGPSAGLMFTLAYLDAATGGGLTQPGHPVAGTGTISTDGHVGGIGKPDIKLAAADGADYFFIPKENMDPATAALLHRIADEHHIRLVVVNSSSDAVHWLCDHNATSRICDLPTFQSARYVN